MVKKEYSLEETLEYLEKLYHCHDYKELLKLIRKDINKYKKEIADLKRDIEKIRLDMEAARNDYLKKSDMKGREE